MDAPYWPHGGMDGEGEPQTLGAMLAQGDDSPFEFAAQEELRERVEAALRQVPEAFRTVVVLREIEGFTYEEIADILQVNLGTVKSRLTRGRAVLRGLLAPERDSLSHDAANAERDRLRGHAGSILSSGTRRGLGVLR